MSSYSTNRSTTTHEERTHRFSFRQVVALAVCSFSLCACTAPDRVVLLREYRAALADQAFSGLRGKKIALRVRDGRAPQASPIQDREPLDPPEDYDYRPMDRDDEARWRLELDEIIGAGSVLQWERLGTVRDGFGGELAAIYSVNDPIDWMRAAFLLELEAQGVQLVDEGGDPPAMLTVSVRALEMESRYSDWAHMTVDVHVHREGRYEGGRRLRIAGGQPAASAMFPEVVVHPLRICLQQLVWFAFEELSDTVSRHSGRTR